MKQSPSVPLSELDTAGIARTLAPLAERPNDRVDVFLEVVEEVRYSPGSEAPDLTQRRESGLAVRLLRDDVSWSASTDRIEGDELEQALLRVARSRPPARPLPPRLHCGDVPEQSYDSLLAFPGAVVESIRSHLAAFAVQLEVARHRRWVRVVGPVVAPDPQTETFFSVRATTRWGSFGGLVETLDGAAAEAWAARLLGCFRSRQCDPPPPTTAPVLLGPAAAAVLLHEAVAHALETDAHLLGPPEGLPGLDLAAPCLSVIDDPGAAPAGCRRQTDDEGSPTGRRWLLRDGKVEQPLADLRAAANSRALVPGAGRRGSRHHQAMPRSSVLEVVAGEATVEDLRSAATGGLYFSEATRGRLDQATGRFELFLPFGRRVGPSGLDEWVGPCRLRGELRRVLRGVAAVGDDVEWAGSGWCAKGGARVPVWGRSPSLLLEGVEVAA